MSAANNARTRARARASTALFSDTGTGTGSGSDTDTIASTRILCYGDSLTAGSSSSPFKPYPYAPHLEAALKNAGQTNNKNCVVRHRGMPGWTASAMVEATNDPRFGLVSAIQGVQNPGLSLVIILAGTNDLGYYCSHNDNGKIDTDDNANAICQSITALHEMALQHNVPKTLAVAIPPSGYQAQVPEAAALAQQVNARLQSYCSGKCQCHYTPFPFAYERNGDNWCPDGLHLSPEGYQVLGESLVEPVLKILKELETE